ncbi:choice-of-anchor A family protein [Patulibacter sp. SYSU D01012]|uniref:choice-of-anchor A family protein n=1 Tax=Patulibacter sp. SYSU D01012 TaxID=2817381 RepID=UPI001B310DAD|nr:choice-of-anchor A family protein [Patulibacter sp. SYSU D01012]
MRAVVAILSVVAVAALLALVGSGPPPARAQAADDCVALGTPGDFSVFVRDGYAASNTQVDGRVFAGGDVTVSGWAVGVTGTPDAGRVDLLVGGDLTANGTQAPNGSVRYAGTFSGQLATPNGTLEQAPLPFDPDAELATLTALSDRLGAAEATGTVSSPDAAGAVRMTGDDARRNVFVVTAAQFGEARELLIRVPPGSTTVVTVLGDDPSTASPNPLTQVAYWNGSAYQQLGDAPPAELAALRDATLWNVPQASRLQIGPGLAWPGSVLAPRADVELTGNAQLYGQLWARSLHGQGTSRTGRFSGCLPPADDEPDADVGLAPTCRDAFVDATSMRLRNRGDETVAVRWHDEESAQSGRFTVRPGHDRFFRVRDARRPHVIVARAGGTTVRVRASRRPCGGAVRLQKVVTGPSPGGAWTVRLRSDVGTGRDVALTPGVPRTVLLRGRVTTGEVPSGQVPGGVRYALSEPDPRGATQVTIDRPFVTITDRQLLRATVVNAYPEPSPDPTPGGTGDPTPVDPFDPPGSGRPGGGPAPPVGTPAPPVGPPLVPGAGADLTLEETIAPPVVRRDGSATVTLRIRNRGPQPAVDAVVRELPRLDPDDLNRVAVVDAHAVSGTDPGFDADAVRCTTRRPVRCALGTLPPGAGVTLRVRGRVRALGRLQNVTLVTSRTPDPNATNNVAAAGVRVVADRPALSVRIVAPRTVRVGQRFGYRVVATGGAPGGAAFVRICHRPAADLLVTAHPGAVRRGGALCRDVRRLGRGDRAGFTVHAVGRRQTPGPLRRLRATADAPGLPSPARDATVVRVVGGLPDGLG